MNNERSSSHRHLAVGALYYCLLNEYHSAELQKESASVKKPSGPTMTIDDDGRPVLPDIDFSKGKLLDVKALLRKYLTKCYQNSTGDAKARIPWGQLQQNPGKFIEMMAVFLPEGASLLDPSHICQGVLIDILCHLKEQQDNKDIMVVFEVQEHSQANVGEEIKHSVILIRVFAHSYSMALPVSFTDTAMWSIASSYITNSKPIPSPNVANSKPLTSPNTAECNPTADSEFIPNKKKKGEKR